MTSEQKIKFVEVLDQLERPVILHEGDCVGADADAAMGAKFFGLRVIAHPPSEPAKRAFVPVDETREPKPYLDRNKDIVDESVVLIACPAGEERQRSGTWSTIRYARKLGRTIYIIWPDGVVVREN